MSNTVSNTTGRKVLLSGKVFQVEMAQVATTGGDPVDREVIVHPGAVVILPIDDQGRVVMIRNERFAVEQTLWELPAGTLRRDEEPLNCAGRELLEETGYRAGGLQPLLTFLAAPGYCTERLFCFVAVDLVHLGQRLEETEKITVEAKGWSELDQMLRSGEIEDAKTISCLLYYQRFRLASGTGNSSP